MRNCFRTILSALVGLSPAVANAQADLRSDTVLSTIAAVMFAKARCGYQIDRDRLEFAMNFNGLYSTDVTPGGRYYTRIRYFYDDLGRLSTSASDASCENIRSMLNGSRNVWQGVIVHRR